MTQIEKQAMVEPQESSLTPNPPGEERVGAFFADEERILSDIAGGVPFNFKRGNGWAIDPETGDATYDPKFFEEKGYTPSQALFGAFHEIKCHLVEIAELLGSEDGRRAYQRLKDRRETKPRVHIWENCRTDAKGNQAIMQFAPSLAEDTEAVYREKLWPETDLTPKPKHLQFMYAILREAMVPDEQTTINPEVREAINKLRDVKGRDVIALATDPSVDPLLSLRLSERYIEPVIEELYEEDLQDKQNQQGQGNQSNQPGEQSQNQPQSGSGEPFEGDYEDYEKRHPEPMEDEEMEEKIQQTIDQSNESARKDAGYETEHGVSKKDAADYYEEYRQVESVIEPTREIFRRIVEQRKITIRRLSALKEEGVMIDPGLVTQTYIDVKAGIPNPKTMKEFEGHVIEENIPGKAYFYWLYDQSTSMAGRKAILQRRGAIVAAEALKEGDDLLDYEQLPNPLVLDIHSAFYGFGSPDGTSIYKPLSKGLTEKQRIDLFKGLLEFGRIGTNDFDGLVAIENNIKQIIASDPPFAEDLRSGKRKVSVVVTTDGGSNYQGMSEEQARAQTKKKADDIRKLGVKVKAVAMAPSGADKRNIQEVYGENDTAICDSEEQYPVTLGTVLSDILGSLEISAKMEEEV